MTRDIAEILAAVCGAADSLRAQAARVAGIAQAYRDTDAMLSIDLQSIEAHLMQIADKLAPLTDDDGRNKIKSD